MPDQMLPRATVSAQRHQAADAIDGDLPDLTAIDDLDHLRGDPAAGAGGAHVQDSLPASCDGAKDDVLIVKNGGRFEADEELRSTGVGVGTGVLPWNLGDCVGRDEVKWPMPSSRHLYVGELIAVDGPEAGAVAFLQVAALAHQVSNDVREDGVLERDRSILGAEDAEVFSHQGDLVPVQIYLDPILLDTADGDVQEHARVHRHLRPRGIVPATRILNQPAVPTILIPSKLGRRPGIKSE